MRSWLQIIRTRAFNVEPRFARLVVDKVRLDGWKVKTLVVGHGWLSGWWFGVNWFALAVGGHGGLRGVEDKTS